MTAKRAVEIIDRFEDDNAGVSRRLGPQCPTIRPNDLTARIAAGEIVKYMARRRRPPSQTWRRFLANHVGQIVAAASFLAMNVLPVPGGLWKMS